MDDKTLRMFLLTFQSEYMLLKKANAHAFLFRAQFSQKAGGEKLSQVRRTQKENSEEVMLFVRFCHTGSVAFM